jgi:DNA-directed RNA polymerase subunit RPC12/RpoP
MKYVCNECGEEWEEDDEVEPKECPYCGSEDIEEMEEDD